MKGIFVAKGFGTNVLWLSSLTYKHSVRSSVFCFTLRPAAGVWGSLCRTSQPTNKPTSKQTSKLTAMSTRTNKQQQRAATLINASTSTTTMNSNPLGFSTHVGNLDRSFMFWLGETQSTNIKKLGNKQRYPGPLSYSNSTLFPYVIYIYIYIWIIHVVYASSCHLQ